MRRNPVLYKTLVFGVIVLFVGAVVIPSSVGIKKEKTTIPSIGSGGYIQDLINNASEGDTIYIPRGVYYETILIDKSINLVGEDKNTTIIDGNDYGIIVYISSNYVNLTGFTVRKSNNAGIYVVDSKFCRISDNIIKHHKNQNNVANGISLKDSSNISLSINIISDCNTGVFLWHRNDNCSVSENLITSNGYGIVMWDVVHCNISMNKIMNNENGGIHGSLGIWPNGPNYNIIYGNTILDNGGHSIEWIYGDYNYIVNNYIAQTNLLFINRHGYCGIKLYYGANNNNISFNTISNDWVGIQIVDSCNYSIYKNNITNCIYGLIIENEFIPYFIIDNNNGGQSYITRNNFIRVFFPARNLFKSSNLYLSPFWEGNYWGRSRNRPKLIFGFLNKNFILRYWGIPIKIEYDLNPAIRPYDI